MPQPQALVIGGTGPTGPFVVEGLAARGYAVTILHGGQHEVEFAVPGVRHIHADPHFAETLKAGIGQQTFDIVIAQYGRLRITAEIFAGLTGRLIAVGAANGLYAGRDDPRWGELGKSAIVPDTSAIFARPQHDKKLNVRMAEAVDALFAQHASGSYAATYVGFPNVYGPRQPGPRDWSIVRRALDRRTHLVIADGGLKLDSRIFSENAAHAILLAVDKPDMAAGKRYTASDQRVYSWRQRIEFMARYLGHQFTLVDLPWDLAWPAHPLYRNNRSHMLCDSSLIRRELGYADPVPTELGIARTIDWLVRHPVEPASEADRQLGDPFDYDGEDELIRRWQESVEAFGEVRVLADELRSHIYRHPKKPGEQWAAG